MKLPKWLSKKRATLPTPQENQRVRRELALAQTVAIRGIGSLHAQR